MGGYPPTIPTHQFCSPFRPPSPPTFPINSTTVPTNPTTFPHPLACPIHPTSLRPTQSRSPVFQPLPSTNPTTFHAHPHLSTSFILCYGGGVPPHTSMLWACTCGGVPPPITPPALGDPMSSPRPTHLLGGPSQCLTPCFETLLAPDKAKKKITLCKNSLFSGVSSLGTHPIVFPMSKTHPPMP